MTKLNVWLCMGLLALSALAPAKSSVWVVEKAGKQIILAGSIHVLKPEQLPLPAEYTQALSEAKRVAFEVNVALAKMPQTGQFLMAPFLLPQGSRLEETVRPEAWLRLQQKLSQHHLPNSTFDGMDAAMTSILLPSLVLQQQGYADGIDRLLYQEAQRNGQKVVALETLLAQRQAWMSLQQIEGSLLLGKMLTDLDDPKKDMGLMVKALFDGDVQTLASFLSHLQQPLFKPFYQEFLVDRNRAWLPQIERWLQEEGKPTLVVVGALHLVGPDSVLAMLAEKGYTVRYY